MPYDHLWAPRLSDAELERCTRRHVAVIDLARTRRAWLVVALYEESEPPTDAELALIERYGEWLTRKVYNQGWAEQMLAMPFPADSGHNTTTFFRYRGSWYHTRASWTSSMWGRPLGGPPKALATLIDELVTDRERPGWHAFRDAGRG